MTDRGKAKPTGWGRSQPNYEPSGKGPYNARWKKRERRERAVARQKTLIGGAAQKLFEQIHGRSPVDWKMMLPATERNDNGN